MMFQKCKLNSLWVTHKTVIIDRIDYSKVFSIKVFSNCDLFVLSIERNLDPNDNFKLPPTNKINNLTYNYF